MAATTGIIGASVVMMTLLALPVMLTRGYNVPLATGTIAASGTLGILIPPSIMLVIMGDLLSISVGSLFLAAVFPGLVLALCYMLMIYITCNIKPSLAPPLPEDMGPSSRRELWGMVFKSFIPPIALIVLVLGSIFAGLATPTEASGIGAAGATLLALLNRRLNWSVLREVAGAVGADRRHAVLHLRRCHGLLLRLPPLGGDPMIEGFIFAFGLGDWGILFILMAVVFFLGFFFDWIEITLIVLPVFAPIVAAWISGLMSAPNMSWSGSPSLSR